MTKHSDADAYATMADGSTLLIQRWLPGSAARVWTYLVDPQLRRKWLAGGTMIENAGAPLELIWRNDELTNPGDVRPEGMNAEHRMQSEVLEADAPNRLVFRWGKGEVAFDLVEKGDRVRLTITHTGLDPSMTSVFAGWHTHLDILVAVVGATPAQPYWPRWTALRDEYVVRLSGAATQAG